MPLFLDLAEHAEFPRERRVVGDWVCCHPPLCAPPWHLFPVIGATAMSNSPAPQSFWDDEVTPRPTPRPDWICHGLLARGVTTLLSGHRKLTRKTTLLCCWPLWKTGVQRTRCMTCSRSRRNAGCVLMSIENRRQLKNTRPTLLGVPPRFEPCRKPTRRCVTSEARARGCGHRLRCQPPRQSSQGYRSKDGLDLGDEGGGWPDATHDPFRPVQESSGTSRRSSSPSPSAFRSPRQRPEPLGTNRR